MRFSGKLRAAPISVKVSLLVIAAYVVVAVFAQYLAPYAQDQIIGDGLAPWSSVNWLGTDDLGRDVYSRLIYGAQNTLGIAFSATVIAFTLGGSLGIAAAIVGGWGDEILSRIVDVMMAIPGLIFSLMLMSILGSSVTNIILIISVIYSTRVFRLARSVAMNIVVMEYVEFAKLRGEKIGWLMMREVLPNIVAPLLAEFGLRFCFVFLNIAALSFLGVGIQPPAADWGSMVRESASMISFARDDFQAAAMPLMPALAIAALSIAVNFVVDWVLHLSSGLKNDG
ncbi:ABC transporter permease [Mesorhizobium sp. Root102]|uniref:ABC transporter permease n=1 Tax=Mesorhizobium sp. Root102 TaxID=1736422 RepID=UPI0006FC8E94|nr:ABC transporter permease [Mesorhizobium sp. Root102]KQU92823.1 ABC transporter permease [Mesorhizobium sp. Root102]